MKQLSKFAMCAAMAWGMFTVAPRAAGQGPLVTATGPEIQVHGGFEYIGQQVPGSSSSVPMYGVDSGLTVGVSRHLGIRLDAGFAMAGNVLNTGHSTNILSYMGGPVFYPVRTGRVSPYVELLLGGARVSGAIPDGQGGSYHGYANEFAYAGGGGFEIRTKPDFAFRIGADYMHTSFFNLNSALSGEGNIRGVVSFAYYFGGRQR